MVAFDGFSSKEFCTLCKYIYVLSVRYNVICRLSPGEQERAYNRIAQNIFDKTHKRASHVKNSTEFQELYPSDESFSKIFEIHRMPSRRTQKKIRFILAEIEKYLGTRPAYATTVLEHVCPYNPDQDWNNSFGEGVNDVQDRLGNVVLLDKDDLRRSTFDEKKKIYADSSHPLAKKIASYRTWDLQVLNEHQQWPAVQAVATWSIH